MSFYSKDNDDFSVRKKEPRLFYEDEVFRLNRGGQVQFGTVVENSEFVSSDETDPEDEGRLKQGFVRVAWHPRGKEQVVREDKVGLADRSLMPGDVVRRLIRGHDTQRGYCRNVNVKASLQIVGTKQIIYSVNSKDLIPLEDFTEDVAVCFDSWIGMIRKVKCRVRVKFPDGSTCVLDDHVAQELEDVLDSRDDNSEFRQYNFYVGQILKGPLSVFFEGEFENCPPELKNLRNKGKGNKTLRVTVENVEVASLQIHWQCKATCVDGKDDSQEPVKRPSHIISGDQLKRVRMLNVFEPCTVQIGDRSFYTLKPEDLIVMKNEWNRLEKESFLGIQNSSKKSKQAHNKRSKIAEKKPDVKSFDEEDLETSVEKESKPSSVARSRSSSSDESETHFFKRKSRSRLSESSAGRRHSLPTVNASTLRSVFHNKRRKKLYRSRKHSKDATSSDSATFKFCDVKPGDKVVVETVCTKTTADVVWQDGMVEKDVPSRDLFPIHALDEQEYFPGDCIIKSQEATDGPPDPHLYGVILKVDHSDRTCTVQWFRTYSTGEITKPETLELSEEPVYDLRDHPDFKFRPGSVVIKIQGARVANCGGQVLDNLTSGEISVWWSDGSVSHCWPQELYKIGEYDSDDGELWDETADDDADDDISADSDTHESYTTDESWETQSEKSVIGDEPSDDQNLKQKLVAVMEKVKIAWKPEEELYREVPSSQLEISFQKLNEVYNHGKELDKLMETTYFSDENFNMFYIEVLRKLVETSSDHHETIQEKAFRLFQDSLYFGQSEIKDGDTPIRMVYTEVYFMFQNQLKKIHRELESRFGVQTGAFILDEPVLDLGADRKKQLNGTSETVRILGVEFPLSFFNVDISPSTVLPYEDSASLEKISSTPSKLSVSAHDDAVSLDGTREDPSAKNGQTDKSQGEFSQVESITNYPHKFKLSVFQPKGLNDFINFLRREIEVLRSSLPTGIVVRGFEDRMDLYSVMIKGPEKTPYEDGIFFFDLQLPQDYPQVPPVVHYHSFCSDRLNPNLYEDGKVCVSLLGTWSGKGNETWTPNSNLLQLLVSIQGLILVREPYFNEAGYERQRGTQQGCENSRMYNEMVLLKIVQSLTQLATKPPELFKEDVTHHLSAHGMKLIERLERWRSLSAACRTDETTDSDSLPEFPLLPASKGFCLSLGNALTGFRNALQKLENQSI